MSTIINTDNSELTTVLNHREGQMPFNKPWELRAFAVAVAACEAGEFAWAEFQEALTETIKQWEAANPGFTQDDWHYYEHFVTALEVVLARHDKLSEDGLELRTKIILETPVHKHHVAKYDPIMIEPALI